MPTNWDTSIILRILSMNLENRLLVIDEADEFDEELVEVQDFRKPKQMYPSFENQNSGFTSDHNSLTKMKHRCWYWVGNHNIIQLHGCNSFNIQHLTWASTILLSWKET